MSKFLFLRKNMWVSHMLIMSGSISLSLIFFFREVLRLQNFHNIFIINHRWKVVIGSNLKSQLKLLFYPPITTNNNLLTKIKSHKKRLNYKWKVVIGFNLKPQLKLLFYSPITTNNNLLIKICCENVVDIIFLSSFFFFFFKEKVNHVNGRE